MAIERICRNCRFWELPDFQRYPHLDPDKDIGDCRLGDWNDNAYEHNNDFFWPGTDNNDTPQLTTAGKFGCVLWQPKNL